MAFNRVGTPVNLESFNFGAPGSVEIVCEHCKSKVGRSLGKFSKLEGNPVVSVNVNEFHCPKCGKISQFKK